MTHTNTRILLVLLEFHSWELARQWSWSGHFGIEEGLRDNQVEVEVLPALGRFPSSSPATYLSRAKELFGDQKFDQVWISLVHSPYEEEFLDWITTLAPIRMGLLYESLGYNREEIEQNPQLGHRRASVLKQISGLTHVTCSDEADAEYLTNQGMVRAIWNPAFVQKRFFSPADLLPNSQEAAFYGSPYSKERQAWLTNPELRKLIIRPPAPEAQTPFPGYFDELQHRTLPGMNAGNPVTIDHLRQYVADLRGIRNGVNDAWMEGLRGWTGLINLPSFGKAYASKVAEAMAVGTPVISWDIPERPRNRAIFKPGEEILLYDRNDPASLAGVIKQLQNEPEWARQIAQRAQQKVLAHHTGKMRIHQILNWLATGTEPDYGETDNHEHSNAFYVDFFTQNPEWSTPDPNQDEQARWEKISAELAQLANTPTGPTPLRILDVGCGRGWLTNLANDYGQCDGVEPVAGVVEHGRTMFPHLSFFVGTPHDLVVSGDFTPYDVIISSEVIEHVERSAQATFSADLAKLLKPGGHLIITTPRHEVLGRLIQLGIQSKQPLEEWLTEQEVRRFFGESFSPITTDRIFYDVQNDSYHGAPGPVGQEERILGLYQVWLFQAATPSFASTPAIDDKLPVTVDNPKTTAFILTVGDPAFLDCEKALTSQIYGNFRTEIIRNLRPFNVAASEMFRRCETEFLIQVDEDMILYPHAIKAMQDLLERAPDEVGMACFHLYDDDREMPIHGVKIYRTDWFKDMEFKNLKASEMDLLGQMTKLGIKWIAPPHIMGRHGTKYTPTSIYRRYQRMYEKDIGCFNTVANDIRIKADKFRETGDPLQLFALLGAVHGIINGPGAADREMDYQEYDGAALQTVKRLLLENPPHFSPYDKSRKPATTWHAPTPMEELTWLPKPAERQPAPDTPAMASLQKAVGHLQREEWDQALAELEGTLRESPELVALTTMYQKILDLKC